MDPPARRIPWFHVVGLTALVAVLMVPYVRARFGPGALGRPTGPAVYGVRVGTSWQSYRGEFCPPVGGSFTLQGTRVGAVAWHPIVEGARRPDVPTEVVFERTDDAVGALRASFADAEAAWRFARRMGLPTTARRTDVPLLDGQGVLARVVPTAGSTVLVLVDPGCPGHVNLVRALRTEPAPSLP